MLLRRQLQRTPQEPQPRGPPPQQCWGRGLQPPPAGDHRAAAHGLHSAVNFSTSACNISFAPRHFCPHVVQISILIPHRLHFTREILKLEYLRLFRSKNIFSIVVPLFVIPSKIGIVVVSKAVHSLSGYVNMHSNQTLDVE